MLVSFTLAEGGEVYSLEVGGDLTVGDLKALMEMESAIPPQEMLLIHNMTKLTDSGMTLESCKVKDGDVIIIERMVPPQQQRPAPSGSGASTIDWSQVQVPTDQSDSGTQSHDSTNTRNAAVSRVDQLWAELQGNPAALLQLQSTNPPLADALAKGDLVAFRRVFAEQEERRQEWERERIRMLNADPLDPKYQQRIAETIRNENVEQNMLTAMEYNPESFGRVTMLYIDCKANHAPIKAFVDSGAQMTFMSVACATRCNVMHLVDHRWVGLAKGVGTQKIIGRVHLCQIQIGEAFLPCSFNILENQEMDLVLGLDMLKRHQCCIDLQKGLLRVGTTGTEVHFLSEGNLPRNARLARLGSSTSETEEDDMQLAEAMARSQADSGSSEAVVPSGRDSGGAVGGDPVISDAGIQQIMTAGFTREEAIAELQQAGGDADRALSRLIARSFKF